MPIVLLHYCLIVRDIESAIVHFMMKLSDIFKGFGGLEGWAIGGREVLGVLGQMGQTVDQGSGGGLKG